MKVKFIIEMDTNLPCDYVCSGDNPSTGIEYSICSYSGGDCTGDLDNKPMWCKLISLKDEPKVIESIKAELGITDE
jgi:hypothetical protein